MSVKSPRWMAMLALLTLVVAVVACSTGAGPQPANPPAAAPTAAQQAPAKAAATAAPQAPAPQAPAQPKTSKVLKMARNAEPFSPFIPWQMDDNPAIFVSVNVYDTLLRTTKDGMGVEAGLATKWEASPDGLTWTFTLRDSLKFSDGKPVTGEDIVTSLNTNRGGEKAAWKDSYKAIKDVQAPDAKTIKVTLSQPYAPLPSVMAMFPASILPADLAKASDGKDFNNDTAYKTRGTGPYFIDGWKKGETLILKRNPNYWGAPPDIDEIRLEYVPDDNTRLLKLQGGEDDVIDFVPFSQIQVLGQQPSIKAQTFAIQQSEFVMLNNTRKPLDDVKIRQALNYATDKDAIIKTVYFGQAKMMNSPIPQGTYWDKNLAGYPFDLEKAKQLMAQSSSPNGFKLEMQV
ncbi:MAG: ABC transporter substrate-binding protein, partial [Anaerolineae bacterium]|nr:ABC transporter substrate-binding protein [Anaerolineae bacterium]